MWIDMRECVPLADGTYLVQTVFGEVAPIHYTTEGGWNTHKDEKGLHNDRAIDETYVARWYSVETPAAVPAEWTEAYIAAYRAKRRREVK